MKISSLKYIWSSIFEEAFKHIQEYHLKNQMSEERQNSEKKRNINHKPHTHTKFNMQSISLREISLTSHIHTKKKKFNMQSISLVSLLPDNELTHIWVLYVNS